MKKVGCAIAQNRTKRLSNQINLQLKFESGCAIDRKKEVNARNINKRKSWPFSIYVMTVTRGGSRGGGFSKKCR